jgi:uncharacterized protein with gpF-like domain
VLYGASPGGASMTATQQRREARRARQWKATERSRQGWYRVGVRALQGRFAQERRAVLTALREGGTPQTAKLRAVLALDDQVEAWESVLRRLYRGVAAQFGPEAIANLTEQKALSRSILDWIRGESATKVVNILDTTKQQIREILEEGVAAGDTIVDMANRLDTLYAGFSRARSLRIASTEVVNAMGASQVLMVEEEGEGPVVKEWLSSRDAAVRDAHARLDGVSVGVSDAFEIDGARLRWPADSGLGAPPGLVINCRCSLQYIPGSR